LRKRLPPVLVAALVRPDAAVLVAIVMLVGWFIDMNILAPLFALVLSGSTRRGRIRVPPGARPRTIGSVIAIPLAAVIQAFVMAYLEEPDEAWLAAARRTGARSSTRPGERRRRLRGGR
jgi:hypothetical protein